MNAKTQKLRKKLNSKTYRDAYVASQIRVGIPFQVRALRAKRGWDQKELADKTGMAQPRISAIEKPGGESTFNLRTLLRIASAFDVGLIVRFAPYSDLIRFADDFSPEEFQVTSFADDMGAITTPPDLGQNVYSIFTGQNLNITGAQSAEVARLVTNTRQSLVQKALVGTQSERSAATQVEYIEVSNG